jgi:TonB family protein
LPAVQEAAEPILATELGITAVPEEGDRQEPGFKARVGGAATVATDSELPGFLVSPRSEQRKTRAGLIVSLALHLLALFLLVFDWPVAAPVEVAPIPVQLVIVPPPPAPKPETEAKPPRGRIATDDLGDVKPPEPSPKQAATAAAPGAAAPNLVAPPAPSPDEISEAVALAAPPPLPPPPKPLPPKRGDEPLHLSSRPAKYPGTAATHNEYLAYLKGLIAQHMRLLPRSTIGDRRGTTVIGFTVLDDGRITMLHVVQSSGYPDIDQRIEAMVEAVGRAPPLPQWFQGPAMALAFTFEFPAGLDQ